jgi:hypothetical protein
LVEYFLNITSAVERNKQPPGNTESIDWACAFMKLFEVPPCLLYWSHLTFNVLERSYKNKTFDHRWD